MKKLFTLCMALLALSSMPAMAQDEEEDIDTSLQFVDANGKTIPNGAVITVNTVEDDGFGLQVPSGLFVKNTTEDDIFTGMGVNISALPNGSISCCFPQNCMTSIQGGMNFTTVPSSMTGNETKSIETEWIPESAEAYGTATAKLTIRIYDTKMSTIGIPQAGDFLYEGPSVTVNFVNPDPAGISTVNANGNVSAPVAIYNLNGVKLQKMQKGVNIVRYADGSVAKVRR